MSWRVSTLKWSEMGEYGGTWGVMKNSDIHRSASKRKEKVQGQDITGRKR